MFDRLVFVEGPSDEAMLREWATKININLSQANVGFIIMGGVRNFTHYASEAIFRFLTKRQVKAWFILDRDERDEVEIQSSKKGWARVPRSQFWNVARSRTSFWFRAQYRSLSPLNKNS